MGLSFIIDYIKDALTLIHKYECTEEECRALKCESCLNSYKVFKCRYCRYKEYVGFNPDNGDKTTDNGRCIGWITATSQK